MDILSLKNGFDYWTTDPYGRRFRLGFFQALLQEWERNEQLISQNNTPGENYTGNNSQTAVPTPGSHPNRSNYQPFQIEYGERNRIA